MDLAGAAQREVGLGHHSRTRALFLVAWALVLLSVSSAVLGWALVALNGRSVWANLTPALAALPFPIVGALVARRHPDNPIGWILLVIGLSEGLSLAIAEYAWGALIVRPGSLPLGEELAWAASWTWVPGAVLLFTFLLLLFPDGRLPSRRWRPVVWLVMILLAVITVTSALTWPHRGPWLLDPKLAPPDLGWVDLLGGMAFTTLIAVCVPASVASLVVRFHRSTQIERQQIKWFVYAAILTVLLFLAQVVLVSGSPWTEILGVPMVLLIPAAAGIAIFRYRLYDIDVVINRSLVYGGLTAGVVGLYVGTVTLLAQFFERTGWGASLVAAAVVALVFQPLRERLQHGVNRLMYGDRDDPYEALSRLGRRLEASIPVGTVLAQVTETVAQALRLPYTAVELPRDAGFEPAASFGRAVTDLVHLPLVYQGETVGRLVVGPRAPGEAFSHADMRLLQDLAREAGAAAHAVRLTSDLQRSRERLVVAREEERRRLRRDLHDGLGPALAGMALQIDTIRGLLRDNPDAADALLAKLKDETQDGLAGIRRIVYGLRPPALDELGLVAALGEDSARFSSAGPGPLVSIEAPADLPPLPAAVEVAAYRIAREAITNAARHSGASTCTVRITLNAGLDLEITDDGRGLPPDFHPGVGVNSMRERTQELGGSFTIDNVAPTGTTVRAHLPLERP
jgi:two-component system NarL family sensor kinase